MADIDMQLKSPRFPGRLMTENDPALNDISFKDRVNNYMGHWGSSAMGGLNTAIGAAANLAGGLINHNGFSTTAGNIMSGIGNIAGNIPGPIGWAGKGLALAGLAVNALWGHKFNDANVAAAESANANRNNFLFGDYSNTDALLAGSQANIQLGNVSKGFLGKEGPFSNAVTNKMKQVNNDRMIANLRANNSELNAYNNYLTGSVRQAIAGDSMGNVNAAAAGGPLNMIGGPMTPFGNRYFANGGYTHGGLFTNGFIEVNNGGSHELNPNQGVLYGVDPQGTPNMVEEGETILDDYVFSKRIKFPKKYKKEFGLGGKLKNKTFADISKIIAKESEERPNDPISQQSLKALGGKLADIQEEVKAKQALSKMDPREVLAAILMLQMLQGDQQPQMEEQLMMEDPYQQQMMLELGMEEQPIMAANGGNIYIKPSKRGTFTAAATKHGMGVLEFASRVLANPDNYSSSMVKKANFARNAAKWHACGGKINRFDDGGNTIPDWTRYIPLYIPESYYSKPINISDYIELFNRQPALKIEFKPILDNTAKKIVPNYTLTEQQSRDLTNLINNYSKQALDLYKQNITNNNYIKSQNTLDILNNSFNNGGFVNLFKGGGKPRSKDVELLQTLDSPQADYFADYVPDYVNEYANNFQPTGDFAMSNTSSLEDGLWTADRRNATPVKTEQKSEETPASNKYNVTEYGFQREVPDELKHKVGSIRNWYDNQEVVGLIYDFLRAGVFDPDYAMRLANAVLKNELPIDTKDENVGNRKFFLTNLFLGNGNGVTLEVPKKDNNGNTVYKTDNKGKKTNEPEMVKKTYEWSGKAFWDDITANNGEYYKKSNEEIVLPKFQGGPQFDDITFDYTQDTTPKQVEQLLYNFSHPNLYTTQLAITDHNKKLEEEARTKFELWREDIPDDFDFDNFDDEDKDSIPAIDPYNLGDNEDKWNELTEDQRTYATEKYYRDYFLNDSDNKKWYDKFMKEDKEEAEKKEREAEIERELNNYKPLYTGTRYAPLAFSSVATLLDALGITNKPDLTPYNELIAQSGQLNKTPAVRYHPVFQPMVYQPMNLHSDMLHANNLFGATSRNITNNSLGNVGAALAGNLVALNAAGENIGKIREAVSNADIKNRQAISEFNDKGAYQDAMSSLEAQKVNTNNIQNAQRFGYQALNDALKYYQAEQQAANAAKQVNLTHAVNSWANVGRENMYMNMINSNKAWDYHIGLNGDTWYKYLDKSLG